MFKKSTCSILYSSGSRAIFDEKKSIKFAPAYTFQFIQTITEKLNDFESNLKTTLFVG